MNHYKHFTIFERESILSLLSQNKSIRFIANLLNRSPSSVSREISRNSNNHGIYSPSLAQDKYKQRRKNCGAKLKLNNIDIKNKVVNLILNEQWSPEQISNRLKLENNDIQISYSTIYRGIHNGLLESDDKTRGERGITRKLRHRGKTRHKKGYLERRGKIKISNELRLRPKVANDRARIGDWEADTVSGLTGKACLVTLTDRKSRYLLCNKIDKKQSTLVRDSIMDLLTDEPVYTITPDRGKEFSRHAEVTKQLNGVEFYFPPPKHP